MITSSKFHLPDSLLLDDSLAVKLTIGTDLSFTFQRLSDLKVHNVLNSAQLFLQFASELHSEFQAPHTITMTMISVACQKVITSTHNNAEQ